jgi:hypothetical protein
VVAAAVLSTAGAALVPAAAQGSARPAPRAAAHTVLVFLRPHVGAVGVARGGASVRAAQSALVAAQALGGHVLARTTVPDVVAMRLTPAQARRVARSPLVAHVVPDTMLPGPVLPRVRRERATAAHGAAAHAPCGTAARPELDPEALAKVDAVNGATRAYDGAGVKVAFLADGIDPRIRDLRRSPAYATRYSPAGSRVVYQSVDFTGNGTNSYTAGVEAFGDAGSIASQGNTVYDLSRYVGDVHALRAGCDMRIVGDAPGASLLALKVFGYDNLAPALSVVQAINYAVKHGVRVINESFGFNEFPSTSADAVTFADEAAVAAGVTVVVSSGDAGPTGTIASPASDPAVLTVGATTSFRAYAQDSLGDIDALGPKAGFLDDNISALSSGGFAEDGKTIDLVAPGDLNWSLCARGKLYLACGGQDLQLFGGTSESAPLVSGAAADVIQAYEATHRGAAPTPQLVMDVLTSTAVDVHAPADEQGAGLLDVGAAVRLATSTAGTTAVAPPGGLLASATQLHLVGAPSSTQAAGFTLTNTGTVARTVALSTRALVETGGHSGVRYLNVSHHSIQPTFVDGDGNRLAYQAVPLVVPPGTARLQLQAAFTQAGTLAPALVSLFAPNGDLAGFSLPQGDGNYADVEVASPAPGRWRAIIATFVAGPGNGKGTSGRVVWTSTLFGAAVDGTVTPSVVTLPPGASTNVAVQATMPAAAGDAALSLRISSGSQHTTIPVTERVPIELGPTGGTFSGQVTGGNGRLDAPAQVETYTFAVPPGERDLDVAITMAANPARWGVPGDALFGELVDPAGNTTSGGTNQTLTPDGTPSVSRTLALYTAAPPAGTWQLVLTVDQPVTGARTAIPFTGAVVLNGLTVTNDLPDSPSTVVPSSGGSFSVSVSDASPAPLELSLDPRLTGTTVLTLHAGYAKRKYPEAFGLYYVPTETSALTLVQHASPPATFGAQWEDSDPFLTPAAGQPYVTGVQGTNDSRLVYTPPTGVPPGVWGVFASELGPFPPLGADKGSATMTARVTTRPFDPSVTSTYPDLVQAHLANRSANRVPVAPGATATIPVAIRPVEPAGSVVTGTVFVIGYLPYGVGTNVLAAIPYQYLVGP